MILSIRFVPFQVTCILKTKRVISFMTSLSLSYPYLLYLLYLCYLIFIFVILFLSSLIFFIISLSSLSLPSLTLTSLSLSSLSLSSLSLSSYIILILIITLPLSLFGSVPSILDIIRYRKISFVILGYHTIS